MADDFDPYLAIFSQRDAVQLTEADNDTIDNWVRYKAIVPMRVGNRRLFSFADLLTIDLTYMLQYLFKAQVDVSAHIAKEATKKYLDNVASDRADIMAGKPWSAVASDRGDEQIGLTRDADGSLRATQRGDDKLTSVDVILPVRLVARRLLAAFKTWSDAGE